MVITLRNPFTFLTPAALATSAALAAITFFTVGTLHLTLLIFVGVCAARLILTVTTHAKVYVLIIVFVTPATAATEYRFLIRVKRWDGVVILRAMFTAVFTIEAGAVLTPLLKFVRWHIMLLLGALTWLHAATN